MSPLRARLAQLPVLLLGVIYYGNVQGLVTSRLQPLKAPRSRADVLGSPMKAVARDSSCAAQLGVVAESQFTKASGRYQDLKTQPGFLLFVDRTPAVLLRCAVCFFCRIKHVIKVHSNDSNLSVISGTHKLSSPVQGTCS